MEALFKKRNKEQLGMFDFPILSLPNLKVVQDLSPAHLIRATVRADRQSLSLNSNPISDGIMENVETVGKYPWWCLKRTVRRLGSGIDWKRKKKLF